MTADQAVPPAAGRIRDFVNTRDVDSGTDELTGPPELGAWLRKNGLLDPADAVRQADLQRAIALREALRTALMAHHDAETEPSFPDLEALAEDLPLRLTFPSGGPRLGPAHRGARGALAALVADVYDAVADGSWTRLKACPADDCSWAFYDSSKNRSRTWCSMQVCGNRSKTRAFRARHAGPDPEAP